MKSQKLTTTLNALSGQEKRRFAQFLNSPFSISARI